MKTNILIRALLFSLSLFSHNSVIAEVAPTENLYDCLATASGSYTERNNECYKKKQASSFKTLGKSTYTVAKKEKSTTLDLDLGLGKPVFSKLKRSRDNFVYKNITRRISKVSEIRDRNIRRLSLEALYTQIAGEPKENGIISALKKIFGLEDLQGTINDIKKRKLERCVARAKEETQKCTASTDTGYEKNRCFAKAEDIEDNCFIYSSDSLTPAFLSKFSEAAGDFEAKILDKIASTYIIKPDTFAKARAVATGENNAVDKTLSALNSLFSFGTGTLVADYLNQWDLNEVLEREVVRGLGLDESIIGRGKFAGDRSDPINFKFSRKTPINDICNLSKCLIYPKNKKFNDDGTATADYKSTCLDNGLSPENLSEKVNQARKKLTLIATKLILKEILIKLPLDVYFQQLKRNVLCAVTATANTLKQSLSTSDSDDTDILGAGSEISSAISSAGTLAEALTSPGLSSMGDRVSKCLAYSDTQQQERKDTTVKVALTKTSVAQIYNIAGITLGSTSINTPFATPNIQLSVEQQNALLSKLKTDRHVQDCLKEGQESTWVKNFDKCVSDDDEANFDFSFDFDIANLLDAQRRATKFQCKSSIRPKARKFSYALKGVREKDKLFSNPSVPDRSYAELDRKLTRANKILQKLKISPRAFFPSPQSVCAGKILALIQSQNYYTKDFSCSILDTVPEVILRASEVEVTAGIFGSNGPESSSPALLPSTLQLCVDSADEIIKKMLKLSPFTPTEIKDIAKFPNHIYNIKNSANPGSDYKITRSIANIHFCAEFFENVVSLEPLPPVQTGTIKNKRLYLDAVEANTKNLTASEISALRVDSGRYNSALESLKRRNAKEKFNLCVLNSTYRQVSYDDRKGIEKAKFDFCKTYKITRFDKYFTDALSDFDFPFTNESSRNRVRNLIKFREYEYKNGTPTLSPQ